MKTIINNSTAFILSSLALEWLRPPSDLQPRAFRSNRSSVALELHLGLYRRSPPPRSFLEHRPKNYVIAASARVIVLARSAFEYRTDSCCCRFFYISFVPPRFQLWSSPRKRVQSNKLFIFEQGRLQREECWTAQQVTGACPSRY